MENLFISIIISTIGTGYFMFGKRAQDFHFLLFGGLLMVFPYFVNQLILTLFIGILLLVGPFITSKYL